MKRLIRWISKHMSPWIIKVTWGDMVTYHFTWTRAEALDWVRQYPRDARIIALNCATNDWLAR